MLVMLLHIFVEGQFVVVVFVIFVVGLGVAVVDGGEGSHNLEGQHVVQIVHDVGVLVVALSVVGEDIALIIADVQGVSGGRRTVKTVVCNAEDCSFHGCFEVINVSIGVFSLQVGLSQTSVESSFCPYEGHIADFVKGTQC